MENSSKKEEPEKINHSEKLSYYIRKIEENIEPEKNDFLKLIKEENQPKSLIELLNINKDLISHVKGNNQELVLFKELEDKEIVLEFIIRNIDSIKALWINKKIIVNIFKNENKKIIISDSKCFMENKNIITLILILDLFSRENDYKVFKFDFKFFIDVTEFNGNYEKNVIDKPFKTLIVSMFFFNLANKFDDEPLDEIKANLVRTIQNCKKICLFSDSDNIIGMSIEEIIIKILKIISQSSKLVNENEKYEEILKQLELDSLIRTKKIVNAIQLNVKADQFILTKNDLFNTNKIYSTFIFLKYFYPDCSMLISDLRKTSINLIKIISNINLLKLKYNDALIIINNKNLIDHLKYVIKELVGDIYLNKFNVFFEKVVKEAIKRKNHIETINNIIKFCEDYGAEEEIKDLEKDKNSLKESLIDVCAPQIINKEKFNKIAEEANYWNDRTFILSHLIKTNKKIFKGDLKDNKKIWKEKIEKKIKDKKFKNFPPCILRELISLYGEKSDEFKKIFSDEVMCKLKEFYDDKKKSEKQLNGGIELIRFKKIEKEERASQTKSSSLLEQNKV